ncbi:LCP family protein [Erysipelothrix anatis]|uniref:LCP family protein n=1 Tax=Erysipelothrix anatis TaxID=2683713 RepID=UPI00140C4593|nr:LCP family protein [Erysipelothrix anatis]
MKKRKNKEFFLSRNSTIIMIQVIISVASIFYIHRFGLLPNKYFLMVSGFILMLLVFMSLLLFKTKGKLNWFSKIFSLLLSLVLVIGCGYAMKGGNLLAKVTGADKDTHVISIVVKKDSNYSSLEDLKDVKIGANIQMDRVNIDKGSELFSQKFKFSANIDEYTSYERMNEDLMDGTIPALMISESHRGFLNEFNAKFDEQTRVIKFVSYEVDTSIKKANVDVTKDTYSVYLTGIDTYGPVSSVSRSDVNMIMTVNPKANQILLTSIPRDYHVELGTIGAMDKLTHAGIYGVGESVATLEKLLGIKIDYYLKVNFSSVEQIVDSLGGVEVYSKNSFVTMTPPNVQINEGMNQLDGPESLAFVRERYNLPDGDNGRVRNQQELIKGMINKALSPKILTNFDSIIASVGDSMQLSMSDSDFKSIIRNQLDNGGGWDIQQYQLSGYGSTSTSTYSMPGWNLYVMEPNYDTVDQASKFIEQMEKGQLISVPKS